MNLIAIYKKRPAFLPDAPNSKTKNHETKYIQQANLKYDLKTG